MQGLTGKPPFCERILNFIRYGKNKMFDIMSAMRQPERGGFWGFFNSSAVIEKSTTGTLNAKKLIPIVLHYRENEERLHTKYNLLFYIESHIKNVK